MRGYSRYFLISLLVLSVLLIFVTPVQAEEIQILVDRAIYWNAQQVMHDSQLSHPEDFAGEEEIQKRVTLVYNYTQKLNDTEYDDWDIFLDVYSIIEHETRWVNYLYLDEGTGFGVGSMQFSTAGGLTEHQKYELQSNVELQIELAVEYYIMMLHTTNCRHRGIVAYNRGHKVDNPYQYIYFEKVIEIRKEVKEQLTQENL